MSLRILQQPTANLVTLEEARAHLNLFAEGSPLAHPDDAMVTLFLGTAREYVEQFTGQTFAQAVFEYRAVPDSTGIVLPVPPIISVDLITYLDEDGLLVEVDPSVYRLNDDDMTSPVVELKSGQSWPLATATHRVKFTAGHSLPGESPAYNVLPFAVKAAMLLLLGHYYENREASLAGAPITTIPLGVESLLRPYRVRKGMA